MGLRARLTTKVGRVFTKVWRRLEPDDTEVVLMKQSLTTRTFETVEVISSNWFLENPNQFRDSFLLQIAEDWSLTDSIVEATHVQVGDRVFVIRNGDTIEPKGTSVMWQIACDLFTKRDQISPLY